MITRLYIKDFILIKELELELSKGFTSITGETGAGKSILVGAIGLILGNRADTKSIREGAKKAIIEADCNLEGVVGIQKLFEKNDLDYEPICRLRRELTDSGKSRAFINDTPVTTTVMKMIGEHLADIHSQHHNMLIGDLLYQMSILDTLGNNHQLLEQYQVAYHEYLTAKQQLTKEQRRIEEQAKEQEFIAFQAEQLEEAGLRKGELEQLEERYAMGLHATEITEALRSLSAFSNNDNMDSPNLLSQIHTTFRMLEQASQHLSGIDELCERLASVEVELSDMVREADHLLDTIDVDPQELEQIEQRIDLIQGLLFKFKLGNVEELINLRDEYKATLEKISNSDFYLKELQKAVEEKYAEAKKLAKQLTTTRDKAAEALLPPLHQLMTELGIAGATFKVALAPLKDLSELGGDEVQFLFATNKQTKLQPIREIASGGEISRFMLALKTILAEHSVLPTVIFDEIDTGVSGEVAEKLGGVMKQLGKNLQVLSITHLPQIAALATHQLVVEKIEEDSGYFTTIRSVEGEERVKELANMLSGAEMTEAALANARELLALSKDKYGI